MKSNLVLIIISLGLSLWIVSVVVHSQPPEQFREFWGVGQAGLTDPGTAQRFVQWWLPQALDYNPETASKNHQEASKWIAPEARSKFEDIFWCVDTNSKQEMMFFPQLWGDPIRALDGTVEVGVRGVFIVSTVSGAAPRQQFHACNIVFKVFKGSDGYCRIVGGSITDDPNGKFLQRFLNSTVGLSAPPAASLSTPEATK